jgi:Na+-transporting methylmalonyl-CoA/oxaloacetate decarboxylase gamma subunit
MKIQDLTQVTKDQLQEVKTLTDLGLKLVFDVLFLIIFVIIMVALFMALFAR